MRDELAWVDELLQAWAEWSLRDSWALGYASTSTIHRCMREGAAAAAIRIPYHAIPLTAPEAVERAERAVLGLPEHLQVVVVARYLKRGTDATRARALGLSHAAWRLRLNCARHWLAGRLSR
jgi:DNA-directed RNA polymerase specialized sigma24 family protein